MRRRRPGHLPALLAALAAATAAPAGAQQTPQREPGARARFVALNVGLGAAAALARALTSASPARPALMKGALGGALTGGGMHLIGTEARWARVAGIQLTALGASVVRNADDDRPALSDVTLPVYPFYVRLRPGADAPVTARLSLLSAVRLVTVMSRAERPRVDWGETLAMGAPVLRSPKWRLPSGSCPPPCEGSFAQHNGGVVIYSASAGTDYDLRRTLAHESVHLAQHTRDVLLDALPASDATLARLGPVGTTLSRFVVVDLFLPLRAFDFGEARLRGAAHRDSWYELEARAFAPGGEILRR